ncbi:MAG TPA: hypothetical protein VI322_04180, partial [Candidatus Saccharimonadia bacterium]
MRQRWTSVLLALWAIVMPTVSVLLSADPALAAAPTDCVWADANTIKCDAGTSVYHKQTTPTGVGFYRDTDHEIKVDGSTATGNPGTNNGAGTYTEIASNGAGDISNITIGNVAAAQTASTTPVTPVEVTATDGAGATCDAGNGGLTWIICAAIDHLLAWVDWVRDNVIIPLLKTKPLDQNDPQWTNVYHFWTIMRNIASVCFILLFLVVIFGTAIGYDNYTIKKTLPRLVAAAILMPLSWYVCVLVTDVGVVLGGGLISLGNNLINPPPAIDFNTPFTAAVYGGSGLLLGLTGVVALTQLTSAVLVSVGLFFAGIFFALAWRNVLEIICIVASPLAYLLFVLPATKKYYDLWWKTLWTVSLLYAEYVAGVEGARMAAATLSGFGGFTPLIQLALLGVVPFLVMIWAVRGGNNKLMAAGTNAWKRGIGDQVDKRFGKDSARGKAQAESRKNNNLLRQATIQDWTNSKKTKVGRGLAKTVGFLGVQAYGMRAGTQSGLGYGVGRASQSKANKIKDVKSARGVENTIDTDKVERQTYRETSQEKRAQDLNTSVASLAASKGTARALSETVNNVDGANRKKQLSTFAARSAAGVEAQQRLTLGAQFGERSSDAGHGVVNGRFNPTLNRAPTMGQIDYAAGRDKFYDTQAKYGGIARAGEHYATIESAINKQFGGGPMTPARIAQIRNTMANNALAAGHGAAEAARFTTQATGMAKLRSGSPDGTSKFNAKYIEASDETYRNDGKVDATNQALDEEIDKVIDAEKAASGTTLSRNEARTRVFNNSRAASRIATKAGLRETRGKEAGVIEGLDKAADDLIKAENILPGATLEDQRQEATRRLYNAVSSTATVQGAASTAKQFGDAAGKLVGFQEASIETAIDDKIASDAALGKKTSRMDAEKAVRKEAQYATGTDVKQGVLASAGANSEIQKVAQEARQSARTDTLKQFEGTRAAANGEDRAIGVATDQAVADLTERIYKTSQKSKDPAKRLDRAAARKMATTAIMDERVQRDIRNQMTSNLAAQAREAGT